MALSKSQIAEIQAAAKFNTLKLMRAAEEQKKFKEQVAAEVKKATETKTPIVEAEKVSVKKGK